MVARDATIPDVLPGPGDPPLRVLFCGINPGLVSAATGHHFARPGNRFWPVLHLAGFTPRLLHPSEQGLLPDYGLGITNLAPRATARAAELSTAELRAGADRLRWLLARFKPRLLAVVGVSAYRIGFAQPHAGFGPQSPAPVSTRTWVLPNPSGLNAHWTLDRLVTAYAEIR
ncbi:MAG TPA: G/U mismatch-specific DNA glycosylase, partial [Pseudonocardiaceae bacterium]|nr:G/U mismatch-specific DNA glycosylase [Pseudonocardiaceae bacterium]